MNDYHALQIQLKFLAEEMQALNKGIEKVVQELTASENDGPVSEVFCKVYILYICYLHKPLCNHRYACSFSAFLWCRERRGFVET